MADLFQVFPVHQFSAGQSYFWRFLVLGDPVVHEERGLVSVTLRTDQNGTEKASGIRFVELIDGGLSASNSDPNHLVCTETSSFSGAD